MLVWVGLTGTVAVDTRVGVLDLAGATGTVVAAARVGVRVRVVGTWAVGASGWDGVTAAAVCPGTGGAGAGVTGTVVGRQPASHRTATPMTSPLHKR
jgi:hypothetical protein